MTDEELDRALGLAGLTGEELDSAHGPDGSS